MLIYIRQSLKLRILGLRTLTIVDGIIIILAALLVDNLGPLLARPLWQILYLSGGIGLITIGIFPKFNVALRARIAGLIWLCLTARGLSILFIAWTFRSWSVFLSGLVTLAFAAHIVFRIAYWSLLEDNVRPTR